MVYINFTKSGQRAAFLLGYMDEFEHIRKFFEPSVNALGYEIVRLKWIGGEYGERSMQVMIDQANGGPIVVEDCEKVSHTISALLDVEEDAISGAYRLEVSSPGIDRPLTRLKDFENWQGFETKLETREMIEGRRRFRGTFTNVTDEGITFELRDEKKIFQIPFSKITDAKLVLTDELVTHVMNENKNRQGVAEGKEMEVNNKDEV